MKFGVDHVKKLILVLLQYLWCCTKRDTQLAQATPTTSRALAREIYYLSTLVHTNTYIERGVRSALVRMHGQGCVSFILFGFLSAHMCIVSEDVMILNVYTRHAEYLPTQLIYHVHGLPWTFAVQELSTKATTHSGAALTSKGSERRAMPVQCQNIPAAICICSGTVLGCHEAVVGTLNVSHLRQWRRPSSFSALGTGRQLVMRHLWTCLGLISQQNEERHAVSEEACRVKRDQMWVMLLLKTQQANCERSHLPWAEPWACSPAGFVVRIAGGVSDSDGSPLSEA